MTTLSTDAGDGKWLWYPLAPADLTVHAGPSPQAGISVTWKGHTDVDNLKEFLSRAATEAFGHESYRILTLVVNADGTQSYDEVSPASRDTLESADYVCLECVPTRPKPGDNPAEPILAAFSNVDRNATDLSNSQESVGVYLKNLDDLNRLDKAIARVVASTRSNFFSPDQHYDEAVVLRKLKKVRPDVNAVWAHYLVPSPLRL